MHFFAGYRCQGKRRVYDQREMSGCGVTSEPEKLLMQILNDVKLKTDCNKRIVIEIIWS